MKIRGMKLVWGDSLKKLLQAWIGICCMAMARKISPGKFQAYALYAGIVCFVFYNSHNERDLAITTICDLVQKWGVILDDQFPYWPKPVPFIIRVRSGLLSAHDTDALIPSKYDGMRPVNQNRGLPEKIVFKTIWRIAAWRAQHHSTKLYHPADISRPGIHSCRDHEQLR